VPLAASTTATGSSCPKGSSPSSASSAGTAGLRVRTRAGPASLPRHTCAVAPHVLCCSCSPARPRPQRDHPGHLRTLPGEGREAGSHRLQDVGGRSRLLRHEAAWRSCSGRRAVCAQASVRAWVIHLLSAVCVSVRTSHALTCLQRKVRERHARKARFIPPLHARPHAHCGSNTAPPAMPLSCSTMQQDAPLCPHIRACTRGQSGSAGALHSVKAARNGR
jgi:hypothetical protein